MVAELSYNQALALYKAGEEILDLSDYSKVSCIPINSCDRRYGVTCKFSHPKGDLAQALGYLIETEEDDFFENPNKEHVFYKACKAGEEILGFKIDWSRYNAAIAEADGY